jgi:hypothetical protein
MKVDEARTEENAIERLMRMGIGTAAQRANQGRPKK